MDENERQRRARLRMKKRRRQVLIGRTIVALLLVILAALCEGRKIKSRRRVRPQKRRQYPARKVRQQRANLKVSQRPRRKLWM